MNGYPEIVKILCRKGAKIDEKDNFEYGNSEQYMMAGKAQLFNDMEMLQNILADSRPKICKQFGRKVNKSLIYKRTMTSSGNQRYDYSYLANSPAQSHISRIRNTYRESQMESARLNDSSSPRQQKFNSSFLNKRIQAGRIMTRN